MSGAPVVLVHRDADLLARAVAARLITGLVDAQAARASASVVLTGGTTGTATLQALADSPARDAVDWSRLDVWWGDERFLPAGHAERNETAARAVLLDSVPLDPQRVHPMPAAGGPGGDDAGGDEPEEAAASYAAELARARRPEDTYPGTAPVPAFDVLLLGVGADGHVASLFPELPAVHDTRPVVAVRGAPKPPPTRLSLTLPAIRSAREVWLVVAGADKAAAVEMALAGAGPVQVPAAAATGRVRTRWLLDRGAASRLPATLSRRASP
ncbi:MAG: 6-phosphogluconolactonase [Actinomycetota bacterium]|nr:6-phosphogluconolactonase [Actinomycetota bacterium]